MPWLIFVISAAVIVVAGTKLSRYGDQLAERTGLGGLWIGVLLLAGATSLPEVLTTVSASLMELPNLAAGDLFGAVMTNMLTLGIIDLFFRQQRVWQHAAIDHALAASLAMTLVGLAGLFILIGFDVSLWSVGVDSLFLLIIYVLGMRLIFRQEELKRKERELEFVVQVGKGDQQSPEQRAGIRHAAIGFGVAALALLVAAPFLADSAGEIAKITGISTTFIGTTIVAFATTLPELVTTIAAVRLGAFDLAVGNLLGSNAFNMCALFFADVAYRSGSLLSAVNETHAVTALIGILLMNIGLMGIIYRVKKRYLLIEPDSILMLIGFLAGMWVIYHLGG
ncbi:MAG: sodium:calcium antiporter [Nitrospiraceae bacterium]